MNLRNRILNYEHWISSDFKLDEPKILQRELYKLFSENKDAYSYYRNWLFTLLLNKEERATLSQFYSILNLKNATTKHEQLIKYFSDNNSSEIFRQKRLNVFQIALESPNIALNHNVCNLYQQYYEIEALLLVLYSFITLNKKDVVETKLDKFRDKNGNLRNGVLIDNLKPKLKSYPLVHKLFESAYNSKVRNTIGHNNYRIDGDKIISLDGSIIVSKDEIFMAIYSIQTLNNYLLYYFSSKSIPTGKLQNEGILGIGLTWEGKLPVLNIYQLYCFYVLGDFQLSDKVIFNINKKQVKTNFGFHVPMIGPFSKELYKKWFSPLKKENQLKVYLTPIVPRDEEEGYITLDVGDFIIVGDGKSIDIDYEINE